VSLEAPAAPPAAAPPAPAARCPLCAADARGAREVERVPYALVWAELGRVWGARFSPAVVSRHTPAADAVLVECGGCGLRYFVPLNPGDAEFYAELSTSSAYYSAEKWEFGVVRDALARGARVLDVGCGDGNFLRAVRGVATEAVGIDTNAEGVAAARAEGLDARLATLEDFAAEHEGGFDVVCSFHVLEHLPAVTDFARTMLRCVRPGGTLVVSVPNRLRMADADALDPLDCPPHHLSRWHPRQFESLARELGAALRRVAFDPPEMYECRAALRDGLSRRLGRIAGRPGARAGYLLGRVAGRIVFGPALHPRIAAAGLLPRMGIYRHTMMAELEKP
jgi:SAM-dependent methyltransferase